ncbi:hypothetical protein RIF29_28342 [Crotalaria pallida]|uniref:Uncharacterized protein n=1 Tax=Crotalaria pallida TaxID=3830 RepID=A0AAN9I1W0_CROPI
MREAYGKQAYTKVTTNEGNIPLFIQVLTVSVRTEQLTRNQLSRLFKLDYLYITFETMNNKTQIRNKRHVIKSKNHNKVNCLCNLISSNLFDATFSVENHK